MEIVPHRRESTGAKFTSRAGLTAFAHFMSRLGLSERCEPLFPAVGSSRGCRASEYLHVLVLLLMEGGQCLEDVRHLHAERGLMPLPGIRRMPQADALGPGWGAAAQALERLNARVIQMALGDRRQVTLDLDATAALCGKRPARRTCLGQRGWMPMVGRIAATGPVAASDFRRGSRPPNDDNSGFIKRCIRALPSGVKVTRVRIDAAGWPKPVIRHCQDHGIGCAIRARSGARCSDPAPPERRGR